MEQHPRGGGDVPGGRRGIRVALALCAALGAVWIATLPRELALGWDESMHAALPAARIRVALAMGEIGAAFDALLDCSQYPFVWPCVLALAEGVTKAGTEVARATGIAAWCATLFGVFLLAREAVDALPAAHRPRAAQVAPWIALALAALSPLALGYAGTLFLEVPAACAATFATLAWLRAWRVPTRGRALLAGALLAVAFFTKFNYGLLLCAGLGLDALVRIALAARRGEARAALRTGVGVAIVPVVALAWWFLLPLPGGADVAAEHRRAFAEFLQGNLDTRPTPASMRWFYVLTLLETTPRLVLLVLVGALVAGTRLGTAPVRTLFLVLACAWIPVAFHPFFLDRFLLPGAALAWVLAGIGVAQVLSRRPALASVQTYVLLFLAWVPIGFGGGLAADTWFVGNCLGTFSADSKVREYQAEELRRRQSLLLRSTPTPALARDEHDRLLDLVAGTVGPTERVAWLGVSSEFSPAVLHLGLLARGGSRERFLRDASVPIDVTYFGADPGLDDAALRAFADRFDVILWTEPADLRERKDRAFTAACRERLLRSGPHRVDTLGTLSLARPLRAPTLVTLFAWRRAT